MDYKRIITAAASFALMVSAFSCGKTDTDKSGASESQIEISTENSTKDSKTDDFVNKEDEVESSGKSSSKTTDQGQKRPKPQLRHLLIRSVKLQRARELPRITQVMVLIVKSRRAVEILLRQIHHHRKTAALQVL